MVWPLADKGDSWAWAKVLFSIAVSEKTLSTAKLAFLRDVRAWRESSGVSLRGISRSTMINAETLSGFEDTGHFANPVFNKVYLRLLAGSYAKCVGLDVAAMHQALDQAINDTYDGALGRLLRGDEEMGDESDSASAVSDETRPEAEKGPEQGEGEPQSMLEEPVRESVTDPVVSESAASRPGSVDQDATLRWMELSDEGEETKRYHARHLRHREKERRDRVRVRSIAGWAIVAILVAALLYFMNESGCERSIAFREQEVSLETPAYSTEEIMAVPAKVMPDSFYVIIHAAYGKVEKMRVVVSNETIRDCWIEWDDAKAFAVDDTLMLHSQLADVRIYVDGYHVPIPAGRDTLVLTWSDIEAVKEPVAEFPAVVDTVVARTSC